MEKNINNEPYIIWHIPIQIVNRIASQYHIPEEQKYLERLKTDMQDILSCYNKYAKMMQPFDNVLYANNIGDAYKCAQFDSRSFFVLHTQIKYDINNDDSIRIYLQFDSTRVNTHSVYANTQLICDIYPNVIADVPYQANDYAMTMLKYLHTICPVQFTSWDFVTSADVWKTPNDESPEH